MLCEYGCGQEAKFQLKNEKWCCSKSWQSCPTMKRGNSAAAKISMNRPEVKEKRIKSLKITLNEPEVKQKIKERTKKGMDSIEVKEKLIRKAIEHWADPVIREKMIGTIKEAHNRPEVKKKNSDAQKIAQNRPEVKAKKSRLLKEVWKSKTDSEKEVSVSKIMKSNEVKPNKTEIFTDSLVQKARPNEFIYSGDGKIFIAGKVPDWFNVNGKKQVIEMFGTYWHGEKRTGRTKEQEENRLKSHYTKYGYDCLIIWESELKDPEKVTDKIRRF